MSKQLDKTSILNFLTSHKKYLENNFSLLKLDYLVVMQKILQMKIVI